MNPPPPPSATAEIEEAQRIEEEAQAAVVEQYAEEGSPATTAALSDDAMVASGRLAKADEVIPSPDAAPAYPPAMKDLFEKYGHELHDH